MDFRELSPISGRSAAAARNDEIILPRKTTEIISFEELKRIAQELLWETDCPFQPHDFQVQQSRTILADGRVGARCSGVPEPNRTLPTYPHNANPQPNNTNNFF